MALNPTLECPWATSCRFAASSHARQERCSGGLQGRYRYGLGLPFRVNLLLSAPSFDIGPGLLAPRNSLKENGFAASRSPSLSSERH